MNKPGLSPRNIRRFRQGRFVCKFPEKYIGDPGNIIYRSQLEFNFFRYADFNKNIIKWGSENIIIPYYDKTTNKTRKYYIDIYIEYINSENKIDKAIIEIKPLSQVNPPNPRGKNSNKRLLEYIKNTCKWNAAKVYAKSKNINFHIFTEKELL